MTPEELERERADLLASIDNTDGPLTDEQVRRVAAVAAADRERAMTAGDFDGRFGRALGMQYTAILAASGVGDAVPGSMIQDGDRVYVRSRSRGRVEIGRLDAWPLLTVAAERAGELEETYQRKPLEKKAAKRDARRQEAIRLRTKEKRSIPYIARALKLDVRTVERYFADVDSTTDRETPG